MWLNRRYLYVFLIFLIVGISPFMLFIFAELYTKGRILSKNIIIIATIISGVISGIFGTLLAHYKNTNSIIYAILIIIFLMLLISVSALLFIAFDFDIHPLFTGPMRDL